MSDDNYYNRIKNKMKLQASQLATLASVESLLKNQKKIKQLYSYEILDGEGYGFYYNPDEKMFVKIKKGRLVTRLSEDTDSKGRYLIYTENQRVLIPKQEIIDIGYC